VSPDALFDVQVKRIHEYKRQLLNILGVCYRYLVLRGELAPVGAGDARPYVAPQDAPHGRVFVFGGKAAPGYAAAKLVIRLINVVARTVNGDGATSARLQVVFVPDYNVSRAEVIVPANDVSQHVSTAGTEASGTSNMKFALNGGLIVGTLDGANVEIRGAIERDGDAEMLFVCGARTADVDDVRHAQRYRGAPQDASLAAVLAALRGGRFGDVGALQPLLDSIATPATDHYLVSHDFASYVRAVGRSDAAYADRRRWARASILSTARMGFFTSDRAIREYASRVWSLSPVPEPHGTSG
jgi:starch phosphorylase